MIVIKFGGSSIANRQQIDKIVTIIQNRSNQPQFVICSAHQGITSQLFESATQASKGNLNIPHALSKQKQMCADLGCPEAHLEALFDELSSLLKGIFLVRELSTRTLDYVTSFGERMSVRLIAWYLRQHDLNAMAFDAWELGLITDSKFGSARPIKESLKKSPQLLETISDTKDGLLIPIVTGFIGKDSNDTITTLGRNGSDFSATLFAEALQADVCEIWSDTNGVMSADPSLVPNAHNIPHMSFREASELARFGGRILHPASLEPVARSNIPLRVMNTNASHHPGTLITNDIMKQKNNTTSIAYKEQQTIVTITSSAMFQHSGFLADVFSLLARHEIIVDMISTSEVSLSFSTEKTSQLSNALSELSALPDIGSCHTAINKTIIAIVAPHHNDFLHHEVDALAILQSQKIDAEMLSFGYKNINLMILIDDSQTRKAIPSLHDAYFKEDK